MTPEEIEKSIEFLLEHQAVVEVRQDRTDAQIAELVEQNKESDRRLSLKIEALAESVGALKDACRNLLDHARWTDARIGRLERSES